MAATALNSPREVEVSIYAMRAFVRLREALASNRELAAQINAFEQKAELPLDTFTSSTRAQRMQVFETLRQLAAPLQLDALHQPITGSSQFAIV